MKSKGEALFNLLLLIIFAAAFVMCLDWPAAARRYPLLISGAGICFSGWLLAAGIGGRKQPGRTGHSFSERLKRASIAEHKAPISVENEIAMILWFAAFGATILLLGFWTMIAVFIPAFMRFYGREKWRHIILYCLITGASIYATFTYGLKLSLFGGAAGLAW